MDSYRIIETDNFGGDYPNEQWITTYTFRSEYEAQLICTAFNKWLCPDENSRRWCKVVKLPYKLQPGFEP